MGQVELQPEDVDESIPAILAAIKRTWTTFCTTTSIHGLKFVHDTETSRLSRFIWFMITLSMFACAIGMVCKFYIDYRSNPTRMNVENDHAPITSLLFPAITICPSLLFNMEKAKIFIQNLKFPPNVTTKNVLDGLSAAYGFINDEASFKMDEINLMENVLQINNMSILSLIRKVNYHCDGEVFKRCRYFAKIVNCSEFFQHSKTFFGHCCSFNLNQTGIKFTAKYAGPNIGYGLSVMLNFNAFDQRRSYSHGFKVLVHNNNHFPSAHSVLRFIPVRSEAFISIRPVHTFCSNAVKKLSFEERLCYFSDEIPLKFFDSYSVGNCAINCRVSKMIDYCGCITFFFHRNTKERVCTFKDIPCLMENFDNIIGRTKEKQCKCPKVCEEVNYDVQLTHANIDLHIPTLDPFYENITSNMSVAHIFMNSHVYRRVRHDLLSNTVTLVSNLGSAFSLYIGMSMVSIVEIIYYLTVVLHKYYVEEQNARQQILFRKNISAELQD